jgi:hypothetical protein
MGLTPPGCPRRRNGRKPDIHRDDRVRGWVRGEPTFRPVRHRPERCTVASPLRVQTDLLLDRPERPSTVDSEENPSLRLGEVISAVRDDDVVHQNLLQDFINYVRLRLRFDQISKFQPKPWKSLRGL